MLTKVELSYLKGLKRFHGMPSDQIEFELTNLIGNNKGFDILKREIKKLETQINNKEKEINKLKEEKKKQNKELFNAKHQVNIQKVEKKTNESRTANVHQLKRILCLLEVENKPMTKTKIYKACGMSREQGESAIIFLTNNNLIKCEMGVYSK